MNNQKKSKKENQILIEEIKANTIINNELLKEIKKNTELNNKLKKEIEENKSLKTNYKKYVDNLFEQQNQELTSKISEKIQNIIKIQYDGKISSNIIYTRGMIITWCGNVYNIPEGWALCD